MQTNCKTEQSLQSVSFRLGLWVLTILITIYSHEIKTFLSFKVMLFLYIFSIFVLETISVTVFMSFHLYTDSKAIVVIENQKQSIHANITLSFLWVKTRKTLEVCGSTDGREIIFLTPVPVLKTFTINKHSASRRVSFCCTNIYPQGIDRIYF